MKSESPFGIAEQTPPRLAGEAYERVGRTARGCGRENRRANQIVT